MKNIGELLEKLQQLLAISKRYFPILFCLLLVGLYGFLMYQVNVLNATEPSSNDVNLKSKTAQVPHIDPRVLIQVQSLKDNSVNVQSLFNDARSNPFQE